MTGSAVTRVREALGLDPYAFAAILGVHVTSVYRWEKMKIELPVEGLQLAILEGLWKLIKVIGIGDAAKELGAKITKALFSGGSLSALRAILDAIITTPDKES